MDQTSSDNRTDQPFTIRKAETNEDLQDRRFGRCDLA